jgi:hypothetical protein
MTRGILALVVLAALAACGPQTRPYAWYKAHLEDAARVAAACGPSRSDNCVNAEKAQADAASDRRLNTYRKAF